MREKVIIVCTIACLMIIAWVGSISKSADNVPVDPDVTIGKLDNGLTYYIRSNNKPEDRAEMLLVVNAGSVLENDDQESFV